MNTQYKQILDETVSSVIEQMAFMFAQNDPDAKSRMDSAEFIEASLNFTGPLKGHLTLVASTDMASELSANILGLEPDDELARAGAIDAIKEILNVICGHMLTGIAGCDSTLFEMFPPTARQLSPEQWETLDLSPDTLCFDVDFHPVLMQLLLEEE